jgi:hypothetical protein
MMAAITDEARIAAASAADFAASLLRPSVRLGVTGLARSGKTVFITALVHNLIHGGRMPLFRPLATGRIRRAYLVPQPDDAVPRFDYEGCLATLTGPGRDWPQSTRSISELRLVIEYEAQSLLSRLRGRDRLTIDIVDYPGEWLLDLALIDQSYSDWSREAIALSREEPRRHLAADWHRALDNTDAAAPADEKTAIAAARLFTQYLRACREDPVTLSTVPPGRFVTPGDLEDAPALTFSPLEPPSGGTGAPRDSLWSMMQSRFEAYKRIVVRPFFRDHFARLDRQIVLVDALSALNAGPAAVADLERALKGILAVFRSGRSSALGAIFRPRIDRVLFAATKADHLHHSSHDRLQAILARIVAPAEARAAGAGAEVAALALASVRATREASVASAGEEIACITGVPRAGETIGGRTFDGSEEAAVFPGDLPDDPAAVLDGDFSGPDRLRFVRFRPPPMEAGPAGQPVLPHIRLDRALEFLLADRFS